MKLVFKTVITALKKIPLTKSITSSLMAILMLHSSIAPTQAADSELRFTRKQLLAQHHGSNPSPLKAKSKPMSNHRPVNLPPDHPLNPAAMMDHRFAPVKGTATVGGDIEQPTSDLPTSSPRLATMSAATANDTVVGPASIVELARALKKNPDLIYEYVTNNIDYVPVYGFQRGGLGALIDGAGTDCDQAELMVLLLRESGFTANYVFGGVELSAAEVQNLYGVNTDDWHTIFQLLSNAGYPNILAIGANMDGSLTYVRIAHMWVQVNIGGTNYAFDPSFKTYTYTTSIDLGTTLGYNGSTFLSDAKQGDTETSDSIQNLNASNIHDDLADYSENLRSWIHSNNPAARMSDIIGGKSIVPVSGRLRQADLPNHQTQYNTFVLSDVSQAPGLRASVTVLFQGINKKFWADEVYGKRLTIFYNESNEPELREDGVLKDTGTAVTPGTFNDLTLQMRHPYTFANENVAFRPYSTSPFFIATCWGDSSRNMVEYHRRRLLENTAAEMDADSEPMLGEALALNWYTHNSQLSMVAGISAQLNNCTPQFHHVAALSEYIGTPLFDIQSIAASYTSHIEQFAPEEVVCGRNVLMHSGALECAAMQQTQGLTSVSTPKAFAVANSDSDIFYDANATSWPSIKTDLENVPNDPLYPQDEIDYFDDLITNHGARLILPRNGYLQIDDWTNHAYFLFGGGGFASIIGSTAFGGQVCQIQGATGFSSGAVGNQPYDANPPDKNGDYPPSKETQPPSPKPTLQVARPMLCTCGPCNTVALATIQAQGTWLDPVRMFDGSYIQEDNDISIGSGGWPYELSFSRMYNSSMQFMDGPLGRGWMHEYSFNARSNSDGYRALGEDSPLEAAAAIAEIYVSNDLLSDGSFPLDKFVVGALTANWFIDQISLNTIAVSTPEAIRTFIRLPDGTFHSPNFDGGKLIKNVDDTLTYTTHEHAVYTYAADGNLTSCEYPYGVTITLTYSDGQLETVSNNCGRTLTLHYTEGRVTSVTDGTGRSIAYDYDVGGNLVSFTNAGDKETTFEYVSPGLLSKVFLPANPTVPIVTNTYDSLGRVKEQANALGKTSQLFVAGSRAEVVDPLGHSYVRYFDRSGYPIKEIDALNRTTTFEYDGLHHLVKRTLPEENYVSIIWDDDDNVTSTTVHPKPGSALSPITTSYSWDGTFHKPLTVVDGKGNTTTFSYDSTTGNLLTVEQPAVTAGTPTQEFTYNSRGQVLTATDETGIVTAFDYDTSTEKLLSIVRDSGTGHLNLTTEFEYNTVGDITSIQDARGNTTGIEVNAMRMPTQITAAAPFSFQTKFDYDNNAQLDSIQRQTGDAANPWETTTFSYTASNKPLSIIDAGGGTTTFVYDELDRLKQVTDAVGRKVSYKLDQLGRVIETVNNAGVAVSKIAYSPNGLTSSLTDAKNNTAQFTYDGFDRLDKKIYPDSSYEQITSYDDNSNVLQARRAGGATIDFTYDELDRPITKSPQGQATVTYEFDLAGRLLTASKPVVSGDLSTGTIQLTYDSAGRFVSEEEPDGKTITCGLDENGNCTKLTYPDSYFVDYVYDGLNRLTDIKLNGATDSAAHYSYDARSRRTLTNLGNGTRTVYGYSDAGDLTKLTHHFTGANKLVFTYQYDAAHNLIAQDVQGMNMSNAESAGGSVYNTNSSNQYTSISGQPLTYDGDGNLTAIGSQASFSCNTEDDLTSWTNGATSGTLKYDALGRRVILNDTTSSERQIFSGYRNIANYDSSGSLTKRNVFASASEPVVALDPSNVAQYWHQDQLGSIVAGTSTMGIVNAQYSYSPFGERTKISGSGPDADFGFAGMYHHARSGLNLTLFRAYNPALGRWLSRDPLREAAGVNLYGYVENNPMNFVDPLGLLEDEPLYKWHQSYLTRGDIPTYALGPDANPAYNPAGAAAGPGVAATAAAAAIGPLWSSTNTMTSLQNAYSHWQRHGAEFPELHNALQYAKAARSFCDTPPPGTLTKFRPSNGDILYYHPATNTFAVKNAAGSPKTMFKPANGMDYWDQQP